MMKLSVIVCTYNPEKSAFQNCLNCLTLASRQFQPNEILIIDNNSTEAVDSVDYVKHFLEMNPFARVISESKQGLTPARLRGIKESSGQLIIFIDDDNFIDENYFSVAADIYRTHPFIGSYSGQVSLEYNK